MLGGVDRGVGAEDVVETGEEMAVVVWRGGGWEGAGRVVAFCSCHWEWIGLWFIFLSGGEMRWGCIICRRFISNVSDVNSPGRTSRAEDPQHDQLCYRTPCIQVEI